MKTLVTFAAGFGAGWAVRSIADSPHGVGVKLIEVMYQTRGQFNRWFTTERERFSDMIAEARSKTYSDGMSCNRDSAKKAA